jgi:hypothetical protein
VAPSIRKKLALTSPTIGGRSVGIVCLHTHGTELSFFKFFIGKHLFDALPIQNGLKQGVVLTSLQNTPLGTYLLTLWP